MLELFHVRILTIYSEYWPKLFHGPQDNDFVFHLRMFNTGIYPYCDFCLNFWMSFTLPSLRHKRETKQERQREKVKVTVRGRRLAQIYIFNLDRLHSVSLVSSIPNLFPFGFSHKSWQVETKERLRQQHSGVPGYDTMQQLYGDLSFSKTLKLIL